MRFRLAAGVVLGLVLAASPDQGAPDPVLWGELHLPGGAAAGRKAFELGAPEGRLDVSWLSDFIHKFTATGNWVETADRLGRYVAATEPGADTALPLPLPAFWQEHVFAKGQPPIATIVKDRSWALIYEALLSEDDETLRFLADKPALLLQLHEQGAAAWAAFGRSIRVRDGAFDLPGGAATEQIWTHLVGAPPANAEAFLRALLTKDEGRVALFYDAVDRLDAPHRVFALALSVPDRVDAVYASFKVAGAGINLQSQPFRRLDPDPGLVLAMVDLPVEGLAGPPWLAPLLTRVVSDRDWPPPGAPPPAPAWGMPADAAWVIHWIFERPADAQSRLQLLRFAQRRFVHLGPDALADVEVTMRACNEMPALPMALERMGVTDAAVFARAARAAHAQSSAATVDQVAPVLGRWQAALGLVEQIQRHRRLPRAELQALILSLADVDRSPGSVAIWVTDKLLPAVMPDASLPVFEEVAVENFVSSAKAPPAGVIWEGLPYVFDERRRVVHDVMTMRRLSPAPALGDLALLRDAVRRLKHGVASADDLDKLSTELETLPNAITLAVAGDPRNYTLSIFASAVQSLRKIAKPADLPKAAAEIPKLLTVLDTLTDSVVPPLVYALAVSPVGPSPGIYADIWRYHTIAPSSALSPRPWQSVSWRVPQSELRREGGSRLRGSWLGVDIALAESGLRQAGAPMVFLGSGVSDRDRATMIQSLVTRDRQAALDPAPLERMAAGLARGREVVTAWRSASPGRDAVRALLHAAAVDPRRTNLLLWVIERDPPAALTGLTLTELFRLGDGQDLPAPWGLATMALDGCECVLPAPASMRAIDDYRMYWNSGVVAALTTDLPLAIVQQLSAMKAPLVVTFSLMPLAMDDWLAEAYAYSPDDWEALMSWPKGLSQSRVEAYLLSLVSGELLVPKDGGSR